MRLLSRVSLLSVIIALAGTASAQAGVIYSSNFEAPTYTAGTPPTGQTLAGQDGWNFFTRSGSVASSAAQVEAADPIYSNSQSDAIVGGFVDQYGSWHSDNPLGAQFLDLSADIKLDSSSNQGEWQFAALGPGLTPFYAGINILPDGSIQEITDGFTIAPVAFSRDAFHTVDVKMDFGTETYSLYLDGSLLGSNIAFCGANDGCASPPPVGSQGSLLFDTFGGAANGPKLNDIGVIDNVVLQTFTPGVPEPATWAMLLLGVGAAGGALRMTRRKASTLAAA